MNLLRTAVMAACIGMVSSARGETCSERCDAEYDKCYDNLSRHISDCKQEARDQWASETKRCKSDDCYAWANAKRYQANAECEGPHTIEFKCSAVKNFCISRCQ
jgi:hypothetical protein